MSHISVVWRMETRNALGANISYEGVKIIYDDQIFALSYTQRLSFKNSVAHIKAATAR